MRKIIFSLCCILCFSACSKDYWKAKYYLLKAEGIFEKTEFKRSSNKIPTEKLAGDYRRACDFFVKAYVLDKKVFFLYHIQHGVDACWRGGDDFRREKFEFFEKDYIKSHPNEAEYGDMGMGAFSDV